MQEAIAELNRKLDGLAKTSAETATNVQWIRDGMEHGRQRMDGHDDAIAKLKEQQSHAAGRTSIISVIVAFVTGIGATWIGHRVP